MFGTILIIVITLMEGYVLWRISSVKFIKDRFSLKTLIGIGIILWILFYLGRVVGHTGRNPEAFCLEMAGMTWLGMIFVIFAFVLAVDIITGFGIFFPAIAAKLRGVALMAGIFFSVIALVQGHRPPVIQNYNVHLPDLPSELDGLKIIAISDTHLGSILGKRWMNSLIDRIREENPDLILLLGDILEGHGNDPEEMIPVLQRLSAPLGVWAVTGNHEFYGAQEITREIMDGSGLKLLRDSHVELQPGLILVGIEYRGRRKREKKNDDGILQSLSGSPEGAIILLSHEPSQTWLAAQAGVDLMLSGHTHGGQIWPWRYLVQIRYPYVEGRYEIDGMDLIVSRGAGTWGPRMRLWSPGEILRIILHPLPE